MAEKKNSKNIFDITGVSVSVLAELSGKTRETVAKRIRGLKESDKKQGYSVYIPSEALPLIYGPDYESSKKVEDDNPLNRKLHYEGELKKLDFEVRTGELIPADVYYDETYETSKLLVSVLENLPEMLKAEAGLTIEQAILVENSIRDLRVKLYEKVIKDD